VSGLIAMWLNWRKSIFDPLPVVDSKMTGAEQLLKLLVHLAAIIETPEFSPQLKLVQTT
jgi:hypothetical protein